MKLKEIWRAIVSFGKIRNKGEVTFEMIDDKVYAEFIYIIAYQNAFRPFPKKYKEIVFEAIISSILTLLTTSAEFETLIKKWLNILYNGRFNRLIYLFLLSLSQEF